MEIVKTYLKWVSVLVIIVGFLGNVVVITSLCKRWSSLKIHEVFIVVLAGTDLILSFIYPIMVLQSHGMIIPLFMNNLTCKFSLWFVITLGTMSSWLMVAIAVDRFIMIVMKNYSVRSSTNKKKIFIITCVMFLFASPGGALYFYRGQLFKVGGRKFCGEMYLSKEEYLIQWASVFTIQMAIPAFVLTILYVWIIIELRKPVNFLENARAIQIRKRRHWKIIRLFFIILSTFYIFAFPHSLIKIIYVEQLYRNGNLTNRRHYQYAFYLTMSLMFLNYCIDPFVYAWFYMKGIIRKVSSTFFQHRSPRIELSEIHPHQTINRPCESDPSISIT